MLRPSIFPPASWLRGLLCLLIALAIPAGVRAQTPNIQIDAHPLVEEVRQACLDAGGEPERQNYQFVFAFNTSHFGDDPIQAQAMRDLMARFVQNWLVPGDECAVAAWEMNVWEYNGPFRVQGANAADRAHDLAPHFPRTPQTNTLGGHDTEQSIVDLQAKIQETTPGREASTIVILLTNAQASMLPRDAPARSRLLGSNAPAYRDVLKQINRRTALKIPFEVDARNGGPNIAHAIDAIVLVPHKLTGTPIGAGTRSELISAHPTAAPARGPQWLPILLGVLVLALLAWGAYTWLKQGKGAGTEAVVAGGPAPLAKKGELQKLRIGDRQLAIEGRPDGLLCRLVGPGFPDPQMNDATLGTEGDGTPPVLLGRASLSRRQIVLAAEGDAVLVKGAEQGNQFTLGRGEHTLTLRGKYAPDPALPPTSIQVRFQVVID